MAGVGEKWRQLYLNIKKMLEKKRSGGLSGMGPGGAVMMHTLAAHWWSVHLQKKRPEGQVWPHPE